MKHEKINKMDSAKRQLNEAIKMFFEGRDSISIHTIACAAQQILLDLREDKGIKSEFYDNEYIRPDKRNKFINKVRKPQNYFKHSKSDPDEILDFNPEESQFIIFDSCLLYNGLNNDSNNKIFEMQLFVCWFIRKNPSIIREGKIKDEINDLFKGKNIDDFEFFRDLVYLSSEV